MTESLPKFDRSKENPREEVTFYQDSADSFLGSLEQDPRFNSLSEQEMNRVKKEIQEVAQSYKTKEEGLLSRARQYVRDVLKNKIIQFELGFIFITTVWGALVVLDVKPAVEIIDKIAYTELYAIHEVYKEAYLEEDEEKIVEELEKEVDLTTIRAIERLKSINTEDEREAMLKNKESLSVDGFEKIGIDSKVVGEVIKDTLPNGFAFNVSSVSYENKLISMPSVYGKGVQPIEAAHANLKGEIIISKGSEELDRDYVLGPILLHEVGHLNDWRLNKLLTIKDRFLLLKKITERLEDDDRFQSNYVEAIHNEDKKLEKTNKAIEYFAEISEAYFSGSAFLPKEDREIIEALIKKTDPEFNRAKANAKRELIMAKVMKSEKRKIS